MLFERHLSAGVEIGELTARIALLKPRGVPTVVACEEIVAEPGQEMQLGAMAAKALERMGAARADVHLAYLPPQAPALRHQIFSGPKLRRGELAMVAARELKKDGAADPSQMFIGVEPAGTGAPVAEGEQPQNRYLLVALARGLIEESAPALLESKKLLRTATSSAMSLLRLASVAELPTQGCVALAQLDLRRSALLVLEEGVPQFFRDIPMPAHGSRDDPLLAPALAREIDISLVYFAQQYRPKIAETLMIVGDGDISERVADLLEDSRAYHVVRFGPGSRLAAAPEVTTSLAPYAAAIGAALGPRVRPVPNLLPAELQSRPERPIAIAIGASVIIAILLVVLQLRGIELDRQEQALTKLRQLRGEYALVERRVSEAARLDIASQGADRSRDVFSGYDEYQKNQAKLLFGFPATLPEKCRVDTVILAPLELRMGARAPGPSDPTVRLRLEGNVRAGDLASAQADLKQLVHALEGLPTVKSVELLPVSGVVTTASGVIEVPFAIETLARNIFPVVPTGPTGGLPPGALPGGGTLPGGQR